MRRRLAPFIVGFLFSIGACTDDGPRAQEPVGKKGPKSDDDAGAYDMDDAGADSEGDGAAPSESPPPPPSPPAPDTTSDDAFSAPMDEAPANAAPAPTKPAGGIISSGVKPSPADECKKLATVREQKACLEKVRKGRGKGK